MLVAAGPYSNALENGGSTPLRVAALKGHTEAVQRLLGHRADPECKDSQGKTPMDHALENREAKVVRLLPGGVAIIEKKAQEDNKSFDDASIVYLLSTRFHYPDGKDFDTCCDPARAAALVKSTLEQGGKSPGQVKVFNPNTDNAYICVGIEKEANGIWLLNWRKYLCRAKANGGKVLVIPGDNLSNMQLAEKDVAEDKGVPVTRIFMLTCRARR